MRISRLWRLFVYLIGGAFVQPCSSAGASNRGEEVYYCTEEGCDKMFMSRQGRHKHVKRKHQENTRVSCRYGCGKSYLVSGSSLSLHERTCDMNNDSVAVGMGIPQQHYNPRTVNDRMELIRSSHSNNFRIYRKTLNTSRKIFDQLRHTIMHDIRGVVRREHNNLKFYITGRFIFEKAHRPGVYTDPPVYLIVDPVATTQSQSIETTLQRMYDNMAEQISVYVSNGSGWVLRELLDVDLRVTTYNPTNASSYLKLPEKLRTSNCILNIKNINDNKCALWCIIAQLFPKYISNRTNNEGHLNNRSSNVNSYKEHEKDIITKDVQFPLYIKDVGKLERLNRLAINIFSIDNKSNVIPIRISDEKVSDDRIVDLLYIVHGVNSHYCLITNLAGLCRPQVTLHHDSQYLCCRCLHFCQREESFKNHTERCLRHTPQKTVYPYKNDKKGRDKVRFTQINCQLPLPFYFVADFECILEKYDSPQYSGKNTTILNKHIPCGAAYKVSCVDPRFYRDPVIITHDGGKNVAERFLDRILHDAQEIRKMLSYKEPMLPLTQEQEIAFNSPYASCIICKKPFKENQIKCRDHCHLTGKYRGPAHQSCNINYQIKPNKIQIPCFFHNLKNYDAHLLISAAKKRHGKIKVIPNTTEKYISFTIGDIVFKDSFAFTQASLDSLSSNLNEEQFINTRKWLENNVKKDDRMEVEDFNIDNMMSIDDEPANFEIDEIDEIDEENENLEKNDSETVYINNMYNFDYRKNPYIPPILIDEEKQKVEQDFLLIKRKGVYPYEYMDSFSRFEENEIPSQDAFYSKLSGGGISNSDYEHSKKVFEHFSMESLQDYHNLYLLQDILLLDDVLTAFRSICMKTYHLDPMHYYTAPGLTWDAGLKYTNVTLDLLTEEDKFLFVEDGIRGGISMISHRHAKANHPDLENVGCFNKEHAKSSLLYLDANNLYGFAMMQYLPVSDFEWLSENEIKKITINWIHSIKKDSEKGYIFEVDLHTPSERHDKFSNYPLAPERKIVKGTVLSPYQRNILREQFLNENKDLSDEELENMIDNYMSTEKLILDLTPKKKYILHYRTLQLYLKLGMEMGKIHRVLEFHQKNWLASYINANTKMRQKASNEFEKSFFKLMNNSFFGKTMENVRKRRLIDIINTPEKLNQLVSQPTFKSITPFNDELSAVERLKAKVHLNKPIYIGLCVLELSKWLMYDFYYNVLKQLFPEVRLLFTDTDSLCVQIQGCADVYETIRTSKIDLENNQTENAINFFDLSGYSSDHQIFSGMNAKEINNIKCKNKKVPGKMKDELDGNILLEFVGLRAKAYAFQKIIMFPSKDDKEEGDIIEIKKLKGITKWVVKKNISFHDYKSCIFNKLTHVKDVVSLRSYLHEIRTISTRKVAMTPYDDKRYLQEDGVTSLPYGHKNILK